jgi:hypothetical protein
MGHNAKAGILAVPDPVRIDGKDELIEPPTIRDAALIPVHHHYVRPTGNRME